MTALAEKINPADVVDWTQLAEPFPDTEVKQRPGGALWDHKAGCAGPQCRETRDAAKHRQFSYVDARAVAQRLDDVLGPSQWEFTCSVIPGTDVVKGRLAIAGIVREDHGYPNSERDDEPIKAATSDALKRCAVLFGIGRHLYEDNSPAARAPARPVAVTAPMLPHRPVAVANPYAKTHDDPYPEQLAEIDGPFLPIGGTVNTTDCTVHGVPWQGTPGDLYHGPKPYCRHPQNTPKARR